MKYPQIILGLILIGFVMVSCAPSAPSTVEIMEILKTKVNEKDLEGVMTLFAEDAVLEYSFENWSFHGTKEIEYYWTTYVFPKPFIAEYRDISVEGDSATFIWVDAGTNTDGTSYDALWPTIIEVQNGKIIHLDIYENKEVIIGD